MFVPPSQHPIGSLRSILFPWLPAIGASLILAACQSAGDTLAPASDPAEEPAAAPGNVVASGDGMSLSTTQRILFMSYPTSGAPTVTKVDPAGVSRAPIAAADYESVPAWSWDNKRIALVRQRPVGNTTQDDIYLIDADGSNGHWASPTPSAYSVSDPSWSPDGSRLVVRVNIQNYAHLAWIDVATGQLTLFNLLQGGVSGSRPSYNSAGTRIIYMGPDYKTIEQINADGSNHKVRFSSATYVWDPSFSPDGKKIAFSRQLVGTNNFEIFVKNFADGTLKRLTTNGAYDTHPTWSPDGTRIAFASNRSGTAQIWTMNSATGGGLSRITQTSKNESDPVWSH
jgi:Tol biopolymer transport system component